MRDKQLRDAKGGKIKQQQRSKKSLFPDRFTDRRYLTLYARAFCALAYHPSKNMNTTTSLLTLTSIFALASSTSAANTTLADDFSGLSSTNLSGTTTDV